MQYDGILMNLRAHAIRIVKSSRSHSFVRDAVSSSAGAMAKSPQGVASKQETSSSTAATRSNPRLAK